MNGVNKVVWQLASHQFNAGTNVQVWGLTKTPEKQDFITPFPLQLFKENKFGVPEGLKEAVLSNNKADTVFHFHGGFILSFFFIAKLLVNLGYNYVLTPHGAYNTVAMQRSWLRKKIYFFLFERFLVTHAGFVQAVGKSEIDGLSNIESNV
ncbi:MAG: glycosyltransferase, partial [Flexibacteraceae bacterium]